MPPRKSLAGGAVLTPESQSTQPHSAAHDAYMVPELRARILGLLSKHDLTRFMRVEKRAMASVAKELYHTMPFSRVKNNMTLSTQRQKTYCAAVHTIDARNISLTPTMMKGINTGFTGSGVEHNRRVERWLRHYHVQVMELLIPVIRKKCANARRIICGTDGPGLSPETWDVHLTPGDPHGGRIELLRCIYSSPAVLPPAKFADTPLPPPGFTITRHVNLDLTRRAGSYDYSGRLLPFRTAEWLQAFKEQAYFSALGRYADFATLPMSLEILEDLYRLQIDAHSERRLEEIYASEMASFTLDEFRSFASIASSSLVHLCLINSSGPSADGAGSSSLSFSDLPEIISVIQSCLVNLASLSMVLRGIESAEEDCRGMLRADCLEPGGTVQKLNIITGPCKNPLLNTLRCLSPILDSIGPDFSVFVAPVGHSRPGDEGYGVGRVMPGVDPERVQTSYLKHLRSQERARRVHLATADFTSLGVTTLPAALALTYHDNGRPRSKHETSISGWADRARLVRRAIPTYLPSIEASICRYTEAAAELEERVASGDPAEQLKQAEIMVAAAGEISLHAFIIGQALGPAGFEEGIKEYVATLKRQVGGA